MLPLNKNGYLKNSNSVSFEYIFISKSEYIALNPTNDILGVSFKVVPSEGFILRVKIRSIPSKLSIETFNSFKLIVSPSFKDLK